MNSWFKRQLAYSEWKSAVKGGRWFCLLMYDFLIAAVAAFVHSYVSVAVIMIVSKGLENFTLDSVASNPIFIVLMFLLTFILGLQKYGERIAALEECSS